MINWKPIKLAPKDGKPMLGWDADLKSYYLVTWSKSECRWCLLGQEHFSPLRLTHFAEVNPP